MSPLEVRLAQLSVLGETITYGALAAELECRISALAAELELLMEHDQAMGRPLRAALCRGRQSQGLPARGFFEKAATLGYDTRAPADFVAAQRALLFGTKDCTTAHGNR